MKSMPSITVISQNRNELNTKATKTANNQNQKTTDKYKQAIITINVINNVQTTADQKLVSTTTSIHQYKSLITLNDRAETTKLLLDLTLVK